MSDQDIVARLRANLHKYPGFTNLNEEAAAEIERLRKQVGALREECKAWREQDYGLVKAHASVYVVRDGAANNVPMTMRVYNAIAVTDALGAMEDKR